MSTSLNQDEWEPWHERLETVLCWTTSWGAGELQDTDSNWVYSWCASTSNHLGLLPLPFNFLLVRLLFFALFTFNTSCVLLGFRIRESTGIRWEGTYPSAPPPSNLYETGPEWWELDAAMTRLSHAVSMALPSIGSTSQLLGRHLARITTPHFDDALSLTGSFQWTIKYATH